MWQFLVRLIRREIARLALAIYRAAADTVNVPIAAVVREEPNQEPRQPVADLQAAAQRRSTAHWARVLSQLVHHCRRVQRLRSLWHWLGYHLQHHIHPRVPPNRRRVRYQ